ncbi:MAG: 30S ribosomal protein S20 [Desulfobacterales bacterium]|nr:30S ribosomal protein S20 [Desulfobacterales bacterium]
MANHKSAIKRAGQNETRRLLNKSLKTRVKNVTKDVSAAVGQKEYSAALSKLNAAKSTIDRAAKKGVIHARTATRKISRLSRLVNTIRPA